MRSARTRSRGRRIAVEALFEQELSGASLEAILARRTGDRAEEFARELAGGVEARRAELDEIIGNHAEDWTVDRMPVVDRNVLRVASYELLFMDDIPPAVSIDEAVELVKMLSTEDSGRFVNGVLSAIATLRPPPGQ